MSNPKGTRAETALVRYVRQHGFEQADRIPRKGARDEGDVVLCPGVIAEVKNVPSKYSTIRTPWLWLEQAEVERLNRGADIGFLVVKPTGIGYEHVGDWHAWLTMATLSTLRAGFILAKGDEDVAIRMTVAEALMQLRIGGYGDEIA